MLARVCTPSSWTNFSRGARYLKFVHALAVSSRTPRPLHRSEREIKRKREGERERENESEKEGEGERVCVCVSERERVRKRVFIFKMNDRCLGTF